MADEEELSENELRTSRDHVLGMMGDVVSNLLYYDRKDDEELPRERIELLVEKGLLTSDQIVEAFRAALVKALG